jgi:hypothetical protein
VADRFSRARKFSSSQFEVVILQDASASVAREVGRDAAESFHAARCFWRPKLYDWVLLDVRRYLLSEALAFYEQIRDKSPREHVAFFVGPPTYLSRTWPEQSSEVASETRQWAETVQQFLAAA